MLVQQGYRMCSMQLFSDVNECQQCILQVHIIDNQQNITVAGGSGALEGRGVQHTKTK